ncbi:MAG TPA: sigma factor, partial [Urbifossiella sp.]|nr:sigma factor [Urbifossiella sp.]
MAAVLSLYRHAALGRPPAADGELLDRFAADRDEAAFAELVRRHGPVVYRVCRRLVGPDAAEDAFQAAFLVLATRPAAARAAGSVGGWLVGVAGRVACQMRRAAGRRARHEAAAADAKATARATEAPGLGEQ